MPIFVRAYNNTLRLFPNAKFDSENIIYYTYVDSYGNDINQKDINVIAFTKEQNDFLRTDRIDWNEMIRRNITMKTDTIFDAIKWKHKRLPFLTSEII